MFSNIVTPLFIVLSSSFYLILFPSFNVRMLCGVFGFFLFCFVFFYFFTLSPVQGKDKRNFCSAWIFLFNCSVIFVLVSFSQVRQSSLYPHKMKPAYTPVIRVLPPCGEKTNTMTLTNLNGDSPAFLIVVDLVS